MSDDTIDLDAPPPSPRTAFVLAGGATRGASQVGMLQALTERGIRADLVVGTSIGALNGACYAESPTLSGLERLEELWYEPPRADIFSLSARSIAGNLRRRRGYVLDNRGLRDWIRVNTSVERLEDFTVALHAVATDAATREPVVLSAGDTVQTLLASSAIPGVFPSITIDGTTLIDGGSSADIPVTPAVDLGATTIYVLPTTPDSDEPPSLLWQLLDRVFGQPAAAAPALDHAGVTIHRLPAPTPDANPTSFRSSRRLVAESLAMSREFLDAASGQPDRTLDLRDEPSLRVGSWCDQS
jgi:NTE family protein